MGQHHLCCVHPLLVGDFFGFAGLSETALAAKPLIVTCQQRTVVRNDRATAFQPVAQLRAGRIEILVIWISRIGHQLYRQLAGRLTRKTPLASNRFAPRRITQSSCRKQTRQEFTGTPQLRAIASSSLAGVNGFSSISTPAGRSPIFSISA